MLIAKILLIISLILTGCTTMPSETQINDYMQYSSSIVVYHNGEITSFDNNDSEYNTILDSFNEMCENSHEMPAFGVSLHDETITALNEGIWIEFKYNKTITHNDMPFDRLLIKVNPEDAGFNIIRHHSNKYEGRCFYLNLSTDMATLYNTIMNI